MSAEDPLERVRRDMERARQTEAFDASACVLATADASARPSARFVLVKEIGPGGLVFYTNFDSRKAQDLHDNPRAALCFHWSSIGEQVRVEGPVEQVDEAEADRYFASRPRGSQLGAWASRQSAPVSSREVLEHAYERAEQRFADSEVARPPFWGGYRVVPDRVEIWMNRDNRLHDRLLYERDESGWRETRLQP